MTDSDFPKLRFSYPFDDQTAQEAEDRGYWGHSYVELANGDVHPVVFYDAVRLAQDLMEEASQGMPFIAERGLIVLEDVTKENMLFAIIQLEKQGFFQ